MFCRGLSHVDDDPSSPSSSSSPRRSRRKEKNRYANCGRDKFATVLADLEARREKIMAQVGEKDVFLVRFAQTNSSDWVPIVVKAREPKRQKTHAGAGRYRPVVHRSSGAVPKSPTRSSEAKEVVSAGAGAGAADGRMKKRYQWSWKEKGYDLFIAVQKPSGYWSLVLIMILLCLVMFGRSFAIICTSIWWYLVPTMKSGNVNLRRSVKKSYRRGLSGKNKVL